MMRFCLVLLALTAVANGLNPVSAEDPAQIRVLSYNIHHGQGIDQKLDLQRIAGVIKSVSPDLVALQEVDQKAKRSGSVDQPAELARLTKMQFVFGGNIPLQGGEYGNTVLSRWPIVHSTNTALPNHADGEQRGVLRTTIRSRAAEIDFWATHFDHRRDPSERLASAEQINALVAHTNRPAILAGDINDTRGSGVLRTLQQHWSIAGDSEQPTIPVGDPTRQIDFIFVRPKQRWRVIRTEVLEEAVASDHRAIVAVLELLPDAQQSARLPQDQPLLYRDADGEIRTASTKGQWEARRAEILRGVQKIMGEFPDALSRQPPKFRVREEADCGTYLRRLIEYESQPGCMTPAYLCIPKNVLQKDAKPVAGILCLHPTDNRVGHQVVVGLGGKPNRQYAAELAERGYVTIAPSYPLLANYQPDLQQLGWRSGTLKAVYDNMRAVDLLYSLPQVSKTGVGAIGHSLGGHNSVYTAVLDDRIQAIVSSCGLDSFLDYYGGDAKVWQKEKGWTQMRYMPALANYAGDLEQIPFDFHELLAMLAPRHTLIIAPLHDGNFRADSVDRVTTAARDVFKLHGAADRLQVQHPDCGHDFPETMRKLAYEMFDEVLLGAASK